MTATVLVTGGTGTVGRQVVPLLRDAGGTPRVLSRRERAPQDGVDHVVGDLRAATGIDAAVDGVDVVLHLAGGPRGDEEVARNLVEAATRARVAHLVVVSVIAADRVPVGYYRSKTAVERIVTASDLPWTILRAAQFHELVLTVVGALARSPVIPVPRGVRAQPIDSGEVAARLAALAHDAPAGWVPDLAGPRVQGFDELVRAYLLARHRRRLLLPVPMPGRVGAVYRAGDNLNLETAQCGMRSWDDFLAERFGR